MEPCHPSTHCDWGSSRTATKDVEAVSRQEVIEEEDKKRLVHCKAPCGRPSPAIQFGLRLSLALTAASLFVLIPFPPGNPDHEYWPQGSWVFTTVVLCCWFPSQPVAASVVHKTYHRVLGTTAGASVGMAVGFVVISLPHDATHAALARGLVLGSTTSLLCFLWGFAAVHYQKLFAEYNYAAVLVPMTYGLVVWPFYLSADGQGEWKRGGFRIANILIGCIISGLASILVFPKSTSQAIQEKAQSQIQRAGRTSEAVLTTAMEQFSGTGSKTPLRLSEIVIRKISRRQRQSQETLVYDSYMAAMQECLAVRNLFGLLEYDPLGFSQHQDKMQDSAVNIARTFHIQTTVVLLDSIIRNGEGHHFQPKQLETFARAGNIIRSILTQQPHSEMEEDAFELLSILAQVRKDAIEAAHEIHPLGGGLDLEEFVHQLKNQQEGQPMCGQSATILFLELVEHLILRVLRLYFAGNLRAFTSNMHTGNNYQRNDFGWEGDDGDHDDDDA